MNTFAASDPTQIFPRDDMRRIGKSPSMASNRGLDNGEQEEAAVCLPQATPHGSFFYVSSVTGTSPTEDPPQIPIWVNEAAAEESRMAIVSENIRSPTDVMVGTYPRNDSLHWSQPHPSGKEYIMASDSIPRASTGNSKNEKSSVPIAEADTKPAEEGTDKQEGRSVRYRRHCRTRPKSLRGPRPSTYITSSMSHNSYRIDLSDNQSSQPLWGRHSYNPPSAVIIEDPNSTVAVKRARNTMAARKSREKRMESTEELASQVTKSDAQHWKNIALSLEQRIAESDIEGIESRQKGDGSGEEGAEPKTSPVSVSPQRPSAGEQSQAVLRQVTNSAVPDQPPPQQQDTAMSGFNGLDGGVDVRIPSTQIHVHPNLICALIGKLQHIQQRS